MAAALAGSGSSPGQTRFGANAVLGGPGSSESGGGDGTSSALLTLRSSLETPPLSLGDPEDPFLAEEIAAVGVVRGFTPGTVTTRNGLIIHRVAKGDTITKVATSFGVSLNTILWANPSLRGRVLQPGEELIILPVSGILHFSEDSETFGAIADLYGVPPAEIRAANPSLPSEGPIPPGEKVIVPGGRPRRIAGSAANLPNLAGYFATPAAGWNWGELHPKNAVDISNACGTPVSAAQEGLVVETGEPADWNDGYGGFVEIEHPNGTATRYSHLGKVFVSVGDYMEKREKIAEIGNTGNVTGITGCHVHFEVHGARNPLAR